MIFVISSFMAILMRLFTQNADSGLTKYVAGLVDRSLSWKVISIFFCSFFLCVLYAISPSKLLRLKAFE